MWNVHLADKFWNCRKSLKGKNWRYSMHKSCCGNAQPSIIISLTDLSIISASRGKREKSAWGNAHTGLWQVGNCAFEMQKIEMNEIHISKIFKLCQRDGQNSYLLVDPRFVGEKWIWIPMWGPLWLFCPQFVELWQKLSWIPMWGGPSLFPSFAAQLTWNGEGEWGLMRMIMKAPKPNRT